MYDPTLKRHKALVHELGAPKPGLIPEHPSLVDALWIHSRRREVSVMARLFARLTAARDR
jgi:hypothetical protein